MNKKILFLAADAGGSKTIWTLLTAEGVVVASCRTQGLGAVSAGILPVYDTVKEAHDELQGYGEPAGIFLSLGGPNTEEVRGALCGCWPGVPVRVEREACGEALLKAAAFLECRAAVLCGTGSTAVGDTMSGRKYAGGWGPAYGDGGSGGGLGQDALKLYLRALDGMAEIGRVAEIFDPLREGLDVTQFAGRMELKRRALAMSRREVAALTPMLYTLAEEGDPAAVGLFRRHAREVAFLAGAVSDDDPEFGVLLCGGFLTGKPLLLDVCREEFARISRAQLRYEPGFSPKISAQLGVLNAAGVSVTREVFDRLLVSGDG